MSELNVQELANEIKTQDNVGTADPIYCVYEKYRVYAKEFFSPEGSEWVNRDGEIGCLLYGENDEPITEEQAIGLGWYTCEFITKDRFVSAHLTMKSARLYISQNKHNMAEPYVYVNSMFRCWELIDVRNFFMQMSDKEAFNG